MPWIAAVGVGIQAVGLGAQLAQGQASKKSAKRIKKAQKKEIAYASKIQSYKLRAAERRAVASQIARGYAGGYGQSGILKGFVRASESALKAGLEAIGVEERVQTRLAEESGNVQISNITASQFRAAGEFAGQAAQVGGEIYQGLQKPPATEKTPVLSPGGSEEPFYGYP